MTWLEIEPPEAGEYDPYYGQYVERVQSQKLSLVLRRQRAEVVGLLSGISDEQAGYRYAPGKWSLKEVVGHLIDVERVFIYRAMSIARGEGQALPGFDQDEYVANGGFHDRSVSSLTSEYEAVRRASMAFFESLDEAAWRKSGTANNAAISVRALAYVTVGHEAHHLAVLRERYLSQD